LVVIARGWMLIVIAADEVEKIFASN